LAEALELLERPGARALAGGQSLIPTLNMRLSAPELLVDITGLPGLDDIAMDRGVLRIGALATHAKIERSEEVKKHVPLLAEAVRHIAHPAIRNRGTIGGSLALADPAAEYPACMLALDADIVVAGKAGERTVKAAHFFKGLFETDLKPAELLVAVDIPAQLKDERSAFLELTRRQGDYAIVGLAAFKGAESRFAFMNVGPKPVLAVNTALKKTLADAKTALRADLSPTGDLYHSAATKLHLAGVLLKRAWTRLST
jgi:carbon-monoxide dehydrogenase medium subunit